MNNTTSGRKVLNDEVLKQFTTEDIAKIQAEYDVNKDGFPAIIPQKNRLGKNVVLSFYKAQIKSLDGNLLDKEEATFDILDNEEFDANDPLARTKVKYLSALFSVNRFVDGGVYFYGNYYTRKMTPKFAKVLTKRFMDNYFHIEDGDLIYEFFDKMDGGYLPYWPQKSYEEGKEAIFSAVNATVVKLGNETKSPLTFNFNIFGNETFDLTKDGKRIEVIKSLLDSNMLVSGFYYKGRLLPNKLDDKFKLYIEKTFIRRNFTVNQKEFLLLNFSKDKKTNYPLFWPRKDKDGRAIKISVLDADVSLIDVDSKYASFDLYCDEPFDLNNEENRIKFNVIQGIYSNKSMLRGALYFDGILVSGEISKADREFRKNVVEREYKFYIDDNEDFIRINKNFTIEDRFQLLNLTKIFDDYYPNNIDLIPKKDETYDAKNENCPILRFDRVNFVDEYGKFVLEKEFSLDINSNTKYADVTSSEFDMLLEAVFTLEVKLRGAVYFKGKNVAQKKKSPRYEELLSFLSGFLPSDLLKRLNENKHKEFYKYTIDKKTGMLKYWPTVDKDGKEVLLSVVKADMFFANGKRVVKACNSLNFDIYVGETFGLVGESGSGKTTISRAILGIYNLTNGAIYFRGRLISGKQTAQELKNNKKNIQMIFQDPAASLNERANIDYIVSEGLYNFKLFKSKEERLDKVSRMMKSVGLLPEHLSRYPHEFSGGQRQRIGIARALVIEPELVLADEPISALDVSIRAQVLNLLKKLQNEKSLTYLFIAHDLSIIRYISDRIAVMHNGHIVELGKAEDIYSNPIHPYTRALLTAIPQPDPDSKDKRKKLVYNKADLDYDKCKWIMIKQNHYILSTEDLAQKWLNNDIDKKYLVDAKEIFSNVNLEKTDTLKEEAIDVKVNENVKEENE